jgi:hypothetical protein
MEKIQNVVIAAAKRTPVGAFRGVSRIDFFSKWT